MKRFLPILTLGAAVALSSCSKDAGVEAPSFKDGKVSFTTEITPTSRVQGLFFDCDDQISVSAYDGAELYAENAKYIYSSEGIFQSEAPIVYEGASQALVFKAVYPYMEALGESFEFAAAEDQSSAESYSLSNLMVAQTEATSESVPELVFNHKMSKVVVDVDSSDSSLSEAQISIEAVAGASYDLVEGSIEAVGDKKDIVAYSLGEGSFKAIVAPQTIESGAKFITLTIDGVEYEWAAAESVVLEPNTQYTCSLSLESGELTFSGVIDPWVSADLDLELGSGEEGGEEPDQPGEIVGYELIDFVDGATIPEGNTWYITDEVVSSTYSYESLFETIMSLDGEREISLVFPNLISITGSSFTMGYGDSLTNLVSVQFDEVTSIGYNSFSGCVDLREISLPKLEEAGYLAMVYCPALEKITIATESTLTSFGDSDGDVFTGSAPLSEIDLVIGENNSFDTATGIFKAPVTSTTFEEYGPFKSINGIAPGGATEGGDDAGADATVAEGDVSISILEVTSSEIKAKFTPSADFSDYTYYCGIIAYKEEFADAEVVKNEVKVSLASWRDNYGVDFSENKTMGNYFQYEESEIGMSAFLGGWGGSGIAANTKYLIYSVPVDTYGFEAGQVNFIEATTLE